MSSTTDRAPVPVPATDQDVLAVRDLVKHFPITRGLLRRTVGHVRAVDGVSFTVGSGETVGRSRTSGSAGSSHARTRSPGPSSSAAA